MLLAYGNTSHHPTTPLVKVNCNLTQLDNHCGVEIIDLKSKLEG